MHILKFVALDNAISVGKMYIRDLMLFMFRNAEEYAIKT